MIGPRIALAVSFVVGASACALQERSDYLIGRECNPNDTNTCDQGQACLPHSLDGQQYGDFRCRDAASFQPVNNGQEAPLAYCDPSAMLNCPGDLECNPDRVREDATFRPLVCKLPGDIFSPPPPDGGIDGGA